MKDIVIIGAGGFGREVQWLIERINEKQKKETGEHLWNILGYIDDEVTVGAKVNGYKVLGDCDYLIQRIAPLAVTCAISASKTRKEVIKKICTNSNISFPNLIDPSVQMSDRIEFGTGNIICAGNILTVDIKIADFCIINLDCTVEHDDVLSSYVTIYPSVNVSGYVRIGECSELGMGAQIIQGRNIGTGTVIGSGGVVIMDIPNECTAVGNPCKPIKFHSFPENQGGDNHKRLLIFGASGHGKMVADIAAYVYKEILFIDDNSEIFGKSIEVSERSIPVVGDHSYAVIHKSDYDVFVAVGNAETRKKLNNYYKKNGVSLISLVHPSAVVAADVLIQPGTVIMGGAIVNCGSRIGEGAIINTGATVDHDNDVGDYVHISVGTHLAGTVRIGECTWVGAGAVVSNNIDISAHCMIGAGAAVVSNIKEPGIYIGVPAKKRAMAT